MSKRNSKMSVIDRKYLGNEPKVAQNTSVSGMINAYNWFNYFYTSDEAKEFVLAYLKQKKMDKNLIKNISQVDSLKLMNIGWNCKLLMSGSQLPIDIESKMWHKIHMLASSVKPIKTNAPAKVISVREHIENKSSDIIAELEQQCDIIDTDGNNDFNIENFFRKIAIKPPVAKLIIDYYKPLYNEVHDAINGANPEIKYAYRNWKKKNLKFFLNFISQIIGTAELYCIKAPVARKPRKKKEKPVSEIVSKIKHKESDTQYNIKSIKPADIVGAQQLWMFNTKYRVLTVLNAMGPAGLSIKGTTVINFDEKTSQTKTLRKPEQVLSVIPTAGKVSLRKLMDTIKSKPKKVTGRINTDIVVLRAIK